MELEVCLFQEHRPRTEAAQMKMDREDSAGGTGSSAQPHYSNIRWHFAAYAHSNLFIHPAEAQLASSRRQETSGGGGRSAVRRQHRRIKHDSDVGVASAHLCDLVQQLVVFLALP